MGCVSPLPLTITSSLFLPKNNKIMESTERLNIPTYLPASIRRRQATNSCTERDSITPAHDLFVPTYH